MRRAIKATPHPARAPFALKKILISLLALFATLVVAAGPTLAATPDPSAQPVPSDTRTHQPKIPDERIMLKPSTDASTEAAPACTSPCYPNCLYQAFPCWDIWSQNYLAANPNPSMPRLCISERQSLAAGYYDWGMINGPGSAIKVVQKLPLGASPYAFQVCIIPQSGNYRVEMNLQPDVAGYPHESVIIQNVDVPSDGNYIWGGYLDPLF
ncbi:hypothetical protein [Nonomuraea rhizosphaerae]|uniref:hypothetical protein n=1 Tax=Nonomuraea rhizosphaerae TaxID=2665663 RepID=UPI001C5F7F9C|nr:hypothetical protein [Nonomuraea rhizosphaerae]